MIINKKLAREILVGNFENVAIDDLQKDSRARTNLFLGTRDLERVYQQAGINLRKKDLESLDYMELVYLPNESYSRRSKGVLMTDVFTLIKWDDGYRIFITREPSYYHKKHLSLKVTDDLKEEIVKKEIEKLGFAIKGGN